MKNLCLLLKGANDVCGMGIISLETALLLNQLYLEMGVV